ncbi:hypothetical protein ACH5RR_040577 [Cinchona calisaya]|uniref:Uncharacterized protein n=1 Tax=Cinchona calisaya TaxID=153742 RepID=A0ABD2XWE0_9GENT
MENGLLIDGSLESNLVKYESATFAKTKESGKTNSDSSTTSTTTGHSLQDAMKVEFYGFILMALPVETIVLLYLPPIAILLMIFLKVKI